MAELNKCAQCKRDVSRLSSEKKKLSGGKYYCVKCYNLIQKSKSTGTLAQSTSSFPIKEKTIKITIPQTIKSHDLCIFKCVNNTNLKLIPINARLQVFIETGIIAPNDSRACECHFDQNDQFDIEDLSALQKSSDNSELSDNEIVALLNGLRQTVTDIKNNNNYFDDLSEEDLKQCTGVRRSTFNELLLCIEDRFQRTKSLVLGIFLVRLRTGDSIKQISIRFRVSETTVKRYVIKVRESLLTKYVPNHIGFGAINRQVIKDNTTVISKSLFDVPDDKIITIADGTYIYIQKSGNYGFQRKSYSSQKKRNLMKPMIFCTSNGLIIDIFGPNEADKWDHAIFLDLEKTEQFRSFYERNDVFILDRGFENARKLLEHKYIIKVPSFLSRSPENEKQLSYTDANNSRFVTKCRFVVEMVNGAIKNTFKIFTNVWRNASAPELMSDIKIAGAIYNQDHERIYSDFMDSNTVIQRMKDRKDTPNRMNEMDIKYKLIRSRANYIRIEGTEMDDFPTLSPKGLYFLACGTYQIKQARSYIGSHLDPDGNYKISVFKENETSLQIFNEFNLNAQTSILIKAQIESRHSGSKSYGVLILGDNSKRDEDSIIAYYCQCKNGKRTVGCCSHTMSIIWYLSYGRYLADLRSPGAFLNEIFKEPVLLSDEEEEEEE